MIERFMLLWLLALCGLAYEWPVVQQWVPQLGDPFVGTTKDHLAVLIAATMFAVGMMLPRDEVREVRENWLSVGYGTCVQYGSMPLLAVVCGQVLGLTGPHYAGLIIVGCVPGAMASNVVTLLARGHTSYSVSLTTCSTLLSPLVVPVLLSICLSGEKQATVPMGSTAINLLLTVVVPVLTGYWLSQRVPRLEAVVNRFGASMANLTILWIIASVVGKNRSHLLDLPGAAVVAAISVNLLGYTAGYVAGWLAGFSEPMRRALTIEIGMQNAGLGTLLAGQLFGDRTEAAMIPALYTFGCMLTGTALARTWRFLDLGRRQRAAEAGDSGTGKSP